MTTDDINKLVKYWLKASEIDLQTARQVYDNTREYVSVLFHIHLSIEKILKALYVSRKKEHAPFSHNLLYIAKKADITLNEKDTKLLIEINEFNIECRYPDDKFSIYKKATSALTGRYLKKSGVFIEWILGILRKES